MDLSHTPATRPTKDRGRLSPTPTNVEKLTGASSSTLISEGPDPHHSYDLSEIGSSEEVNPSTTPPTTANRRIRWAILASACFVMFGNYYAFDNPAALNKPLQDYMLQTDDQYAYFLNLLYTSYSIPNVILPWIGGYAADRLGLQKMLLFLSVIVVLGQAVVCIGLERRNEAVMILGRVLFGAAETLYVAQSAITVKYFRGKELAMALGVNLCVSRLGSVLNDVLSVYIWSRSSVPAAFWGGFVSCVLSLLCACMLVWLDLRYGDTMTTPPPLERSRPSSCLVDSSLTFEGTEDPTSHSEKKSTESQRLSPPSIREEAREPTSTLGVHGYLQRPATNTTQTVMKQLFDYSPRYWILLFMALLLIGVVVPFNSIHAGFLQKRWYPGDPQKSAQIMTVPDLLSAVLVLPVGYFVDHYGQKTWLFMFCGAIIGSSHLILGLSHIPTPVPCLVALGISSAIGAIFSSALPVLVRSDQMATA
ncbi:hypothetical protein EMPS_01238 [Entomortierella parvispora]|uniref:Lysosomal dipeptide transporter MFSD1 n=1 Tax=Entomortierella parvispora TaxID=205924 RepID=A0A9P3H2K8_9FUNG|nr:hypothetical protein EMPS_01238 [Entomortierella parvispora]